MLNVAGLVVGQWMRIGKQDFLELGTQIGDVVGH